MWFHSIAFAQIEVYQRDYDPSAGENAYDDDFNTDGNFDDYNENFQEDGGISIDPPENPQETPEIFPPEISEDEGLEFYVYNQNGVMAFAIIAAHENYKIRPVLARNQIRGLATVSNMSENIDDIATINASYFAPDGSLYGITKIDGTIVATDYFNRSAIGISKDGSIKFGRVRYQGKLSFRGKSIFVGGVNSVRGVNSAVIYNKYFGKTTGTNEFGVELVVKDGVIQEIFRDKGNNFIPQDGYIVSAHGTAAELFKNAKVGNKISFDEKISSDDADFDSIPYVLGAGPRLVKDGKIFVTVAEEQFPPDIRFGRAPRSAFGVTKYGDYIFAVVDGRQAHSRGCTLQEWADILLNQFGAVDAINLDGGGSSELVVKDNLVNSPSDGRERSVGSALMILPKGY